MNIKNYRDLNHNYIILKCGNLEKDKYKYRVVSSGKTESLLTGKVHNINGESYIYYEVDSKVSLRTFAESGGFTSESFLMLFENLTEALDDMKEYLIGEEGVLFDLDTVFYDLKNERFYFAYLPDYKCENPVSEISGQLMEYCDMADEAVSEMIYFFCEYSEDDNNPMLSEISQKIISSYGIENKNAVNAEFIQNTGIENIGGDSDMACLESETSKTLLGEKALDRKSDFEKDNLVTKTNEGRITKLILAAAFLIVIVCTIYLQIFYVLSYREKMISYAVMLICAAMSVYSTISFFKTPKRDIDEDRKGTCFGKKKYEIEEDEYDAEFENAILEASASGKGQSIAISENSYDDEIDNEDEDYGQTVLLGDDFFDKKIKLYNKENDSLQIDMEKLPLTVGKFPGLSDIVIKNSSVSRLHAKIFENENGEIKLRDLNSTNGTLRNGKKLQSGETVQIKRGDEIVFGNVVYECR